MIKPNTKFALILTQEQINYLIDLLEPIAEEANGENEQLEDILRQFDENCCVLDENEEFIRV